MKQTDQGVDKKKQVMEGLAGFLTRYRTVLVTTLVVAAVAVVALVIVLTVQSNRSEQALERVETLQEQYRDWSAEGEAAEEGAAVDGFSEIESAAISLIDDYPNTYASVRARMILAEGAFLLEDWQSAAQHFGMVADAVDGTYLGTVARMAAAISLENAGDTDGALAGFRAVAASEDLGYGFAPRALFSVGRIEESRDEIVAASEAYQSLIDDYPTSSWTNMARNRIITLTVEGRIGE